MMDNGDKDDFYFTVWMVVIGVISVALAVTFIWAIVKIILWLTSLQLGG